ncbi:MULTISPECIES: hypothetical protein [unclassified Pseudomonas]|uniref:hypothetical protein n=1 Tax=unclassified Pseudomonas TaxID=196821 RepID=UPI00117A0F19|nr:MULTISPECIES: hypothetical protein [unclassified Pseudomonas]
MGILIGAGGEGCVSNIALKKFDSLAIEFSKVFFHRSVKGAWRYRHFKFAIFMFACMLISCALFSFSGLFIKQGLFDFISLIFLFLMVFFEIVAIVILEKWYEPIWRSISLRKAGLLGYGAIYSRRDLHHYKEKWLKRAFSVTPDRYIELVKAVVEAEELRKASKGRMKHLGDRFLSGFFSLKPLGGLSLFSILFVVGSVLLKVAGSNYKMVVENVELIFSEFWVRFAVWGVMFVLGVMCVGILLMVGGGVLQMILERKMGICSPTSRERLIWQLINSSVVVLK